MSDKQLQPRINIPIEITDLPLFGGSKENMKDTFVTEMKRIDEEMTKFSTNVLGLYGQTDALTTSKDTKPISWEALTTSPLIEGEGEDRVIKLHFDLSGFDPTELDVEFWTCVMWQLLVHVDVINDLLQVTATHEFKTDTSTTMKEYKREFHLLKGVDPQRITSSLTKEGVLVIQAPLPPIDNNLTIK